MERQKSHPQKHYSRRLGSHSSSRQAREATVAMVWTFHCSKYDQARNHLSAKWRSHRSNPHLECRQPEPVLPIVSRTCHSLSVVIYNFQFLFSFKFQQIQGDSHSFSSQGKPLRKGVRFFNEAILCTPLQPLSKIFPTKQYWQSAKTSLHRAWISTAPSKEAGCFGHHFAGNCRQTTQPKNPTG